MQYALTDPCGERPACDPARHLGQSAPTTLEDVGSMPPPASYPRLMTRYRPRPLTCLVDTSELAHGHTSRFANQVPGGFERRGSARKWWEWDYLARCAEEVGVLNGRSVGVGLGVGTEPLIFYFANHCQRIVATDLYSDDTIWRESRYEHAAAVYKTSPIPFPRERVEICNADMRALPVADRSCDFAWSCSSIEHVPTLRDLLVVFDELARVLKIGGYAFLTTEFCLTEPPYLLPCLNAWDPNLLGLLEGALGAFEFVGVKDLSYNFAWPANAPRARRYDPGGTPALMVGLSVIAPVAFVLRRRRGSNITWEDLRITEEVRAYTECTAQLRSGNVEGIVERLRPLVDQRPGRLTPQFYHHLFRYYIEAAVQGGKLTPRDLDRELSGFLEHLPAGSVHDADCLDYIAHLLGTIGRHDDSARVYRLALNSPTTCQDHIASLLFDYLRAMRQAARFGEGLDGAIAVLRDLASNGIALADLAGPIKRAVERSGLQGEELRFIRYVFANCIAECEKTRQDQRAAWASVLEGIA